MEKAEVIRDALTEIGVTALIDEATGYQEVRAKDALAKILEKYLNPHFAKWTQTFPEEFYKEMFRLKDWDFYDPQSVKRPKIVGRYTNDIIYKRIAPGIYDELRKRNPKKSKRHHQLFTGDFGHPALTHFIDKVLLLMRISHDWDEFYRYMQRTMPIIEDNSSVLIEEEYSED